MCTAAEGRDKRDCATAAITADLAVACASRERLIVGARLLGCCCKYITMPQEKNPAHLA